MRSIFAIEQVKHAVTGYRAAVNAMLGMHDAAAKEVDKRLGDDRTVFLPSAALSLRELEAALR